MPWLPWAGSPPAGLLLPGMDGEPDWVLLGVPGEPGEDGVDCEGDCEDGLDGLGICDDGLDGCDDGLDGMGGELDGVEGDEGEEGEGIEGLDDEDELVLSQAASTPARHSTASPCPARTALSCLAMLRMSTLTLSSGMDRYRRCYRQGRERPRSLCILRPYCHRVNYHSLQAVFYSQPHINPAAWTGRY